MTTGRWKQRCYNLSHTFNVVLGSFNVCIKLITVLNFNIFILYHVTLKHICKSVTKLNRKLILCLVLLKHVLSFLGCSWPLIPLRVHTSMLYWLPCLYPPHTEKCFPIKSASHCNKIASSIIGNGIRITV